MAVLNSNSRAQEILETLEAGRISFTESGEGYAFQTVTTSGRDSCLSLLCQLGSVLLGCSSRGAPRGSR